MSKLVSFKPDRNSLWSHQDFQRRAITKRGIVIDGITKTVDPKRVYVGDRVITPRGIGRVAIIDDDVICVDIDPNADVLYEFDRDEVARHKKKPKRKRKKR